jgi:hypothetical protein
MPHNNPSGGPSFTPAEDRLIRDLAAKGFTALGIAGRLTDRTRNSVLGYCHRNNIQFLRAKKRKHIPSTQNAPPRAMDPPEEPNPILPPESKPMSLHDAGNGHCRFVIGEVRALMICGAEIVEGSYCRYHAAKCLVPLPRKRSEAV